MDEERENPFTPGWGKVPPHRAGHETAALELFELVDNIGKGKVGDGVVLYGPRGAGKTVLLEEVRERAVNRGAGVRWLEPGDWEGTMDDFVKGLPDDIMGDSEQTVKIEVNLGFLKVSVDRKLDSPYRLVSKALRALADTIPIVLLVDEAHDMPPNIAKVLLNAVQRCVTSRLPLLLVLAGTPELRASLRRSHASFWERSIRLRIGRLESEDATRVALSLPAQRQGLPFADDALEYLVAESQGYPFFIQLLGKWSWRAAIARDPSADRIRLEDAEAGVLSATKERDELYEDRLGEITDRNLKSEALAVSEAFVAPEAVDVLSRTTLGAVLKPALTEDRTIDGVIKELFAVGLIWQTDDPSLWEPAIPSLCAHIVKYAVVD